MQKLLICCEIKVSMLRPKANKVFVKKVSLHKYLFLLNYIVKKLNFVKTVLFCIFKMWFINFIHIIVLIFKQKEK